MLAAISGLTFIIVIAILAVFIPILFRRVVSTNMVHIVQSKKKTVSYGTGKPAGNVYYAWPSWLPFIGVTVIKMPVSNFDLSLKSYEAYDKDRVPFMVDVTAFFRIDDSEMAAQRVSTYEQLVEQLRQIVQGAVRKVLSSDNINAIMLERAKFGEAFSSEVTENLAEWGIKSVKSMELMDIRDTNGSEVIANIMAMKTSQIEMESRREVANNKKIAETAEIEAQQAVDIRKQEAEQQVGQRTAEKDKAVGIANEQANQEVLAQQKETRERDMAVKRVEQVRQAEIEKDRQVVAAEQDKQTTVIKAEGNLEAKRREATGIQVEGEAKASAEKLMQLAPVEAQIVLAKEIGLNPAYQQYLATIEALKSYVVVGGKQAEALQEADVKVIANTGHPTEGVKSVMDLFSSSGGTNLAAALEALSQSPLTRDALAKIGIGVASKQVQPVAVAPVDDDSRTDGKMATEESVTAPPVLEKSDNQTVPGRGSGGGTMF